MLDAKLVCAELKKQTKAIRKPSYSRRKSRLDRYSFELLQLLDEGSSIAELQRWLRYQNRIKVAHSTVARWVRRNA